MRVGVDTGGTFTDVVDAVGPPREGAVDPCRSGGGGACRPRRGRRRRRAGRARGRHDRRDEHAARTSWRMRRAPDERRLRGPHRDRPAGSSVAVRPVGRPAGAAGAPLASADSAGTDGRRRHELVALDLSSLPSVPGEVETVAVCFLHADRWPAHERAAVAELGAARRRRRRLPRGLTRASASTSGW